MSGIIEFEVRNEQQQQPSIDKKSFDANNSSSSSGLSSEDEEYYFSSQKTASKLFKSMNSSGNKIDSDRFMSLPVREKHETFLRQLLNQVLNQAVFDGTKRENKVNEWTNPEELLKIMDLALKDEPENDEQMLKLAENTIKYSVKTGHPYFVNQLFSTIDPYALGGQFITDALNPR